MTRLGYVFSSHDFGYPTYTLPSLRTMMIILGFTSHVTRFMSRTEMILERILGSVARKSLAFWINTFGNNIPYLTKQVVSGSSDHALDDFTEQLSM